MNIHPCSGSDSGVVKVWNILENDPIAQFRNSPSMRGASPRDSIQPITTLEFHPHDMVLAVGATNAKLNVSTASEAYAWGKAVRASINITD